MSSPAFFQTGMGRTFFEHTLPQLVQAVQTLSSQLKDLHGLAKQWIDQQPRTVYKPPSVDASADASTKTVYLDTVYIGTRVQPIHGQRVRVCGVFRDHDGGAADLTDVVRPPTHVHGWRDVSAHCWAYVAAFSAKGWMSPTLDAVSVLDLECFAHLLPTNTKGQP